MCSCFCTSGLVASRWRQKMHAWEVLSTPAYCYCCQHLLAKNSNTLAFTCLQKSQILIAKISNTVVYTWHKTELQELDFEEKTVPKQKENCSYDLKEFFDKSDEHLLDLEFSGGKEEHKVSQRCPLPLPSRKSTEKWHFGCPNKHSESYFYKPSITISLPDISSSLLAKHNFPLKFHS